MTLTVCMIARNEEATIGLALDSLTIDGKPIWDELVVVLAGESTDRTLEIARGYGAITAHYPPDGAWPTVDGVEQRHYGNARQVAEDIATSEYVLWIDADERLVAGHEAIMRTVKAGRLVGVRPRIRIDTNTSQSRQELLHKRGQFRWQGAIHEWLAGPPVPVASDIVYEEIERPDGDRPHADVFDALRMEVGNAIEERTAPAGMYERVLYYLGREHANRSIDEPDRPHWHEAIACGRMFMESTNGPPERRQEVAFHIGWAWEQIGDMHQARRAYLDAIKESGDWAEPYHALSLIARRNGLWNEALGWASHALWMDQPEGWSYGDLYEWQRYENFAQCLVQTGQFAAALPYFEKVAEVHPSESATYGIELCRAELKKAEASALVIAR